MVFIHIKTEKLEQEKKEISLNKLLEGEEKERSRIAKELHDGVVQDLTAIYLNLNQAENLSEEERKEKYKLLLQHIKQTSAEVRNLSHQMMPLTLNEKGLVLALEELFERNLNPMDIQYNFDIFGIDERLTRKIEFTIYRVTQELVNNIIKHSQATEVSCILRKVQQKIIFIFEDNGVGLQTNGLSSGIGFENLKSRLDFVNGSLEINSNEQQKGLLTRIEIPL